LPVAPGLLQLDVAVCFAGEQPSPEGALGVHDAVGMFVRCGRVLGPVGALQYPNPLVLIDHSVTLWVGDDGVEAQQSILR